MGLRLKKRLDQQGWVMGPQVAKGWGSQTGQKTGVEAGGGSLGRRGSPRGTLKGQVVGGEQEGPRNEAPGPDTAPNSDNAFPIRDIAQL